MDEKGDTHIMMICVSLFRYKTERGSRQLSLNKDYNKENLVFYYEAIQNENYKELDYELDIPVLVEMVFRLLGDKLLT